MKHLVSYLRRRTVSGSWIPELDGLRFIAIVSVILFHIEGQFINHGAVTAESTSNWFAVMVGNGNRGVPLFFVISGFILARPFAEHHLFQKPRPALLKYFGRRLTRLEPPYILNLLAAAAALLLIDRHPLSWVLPHLAASLIYLHNIIFLAPSVINSVAWSLEIEVQFYTLAPLLTMLFLIRTAWLRRAVIVALMLSAGLLQTAYRVDMGTLAGLTLAGWVQYFLAGLLFADFYLTLFRDWPNDWRWDLVGLVGWPAVFALPARGMPIWLPFLTVLLYVAAFRGRFVLALLRNSWVAVIGGACYTIYLWHPLILTAADRVCRSIPLLRFQNFALLFLVQGFIKIASTALVCLPLFYFVERPFMDPKWPQKLLAFFRNGRRAVKPVTAGTD